LRKKIIAVNDKMQCGYRYELTAPAGRNFDPEFGPELTPADMLLLGVFGGKYMTDCTKEFPKSWFARAKLAKGHRDRSLNYFGVDASQPLSVWRNKGWIFHERPTSICVTTEYLEVERGSVHPDVRELHHFAPFLGFVGDELAEPRGRHRHRLGAQIS
jgi:hypothetical protein